MSRIVFKKTLFWLLVILLVLNAACSRQKKDWEEAEKNPSILAYHEFFSKYPDGKYAPEAKLRIEELEFQGIQRTNTVESYKRYLEENPTGRFVEAAREGLDNLDWLTAEKEWMPAAWEKYLADHPQARHETEARSRLEALREARSPEFRDVRTVKIVVRQSFSEPVKDVAIGFESALDEIFPYFGIQKADPDSAAEATINVNGYAEPLGASYSPFGLGFGSYYYTGARVSGQVSLAAAGGKPIQERFNGEDPVPYSISGGSSDPSDAPYDAAMEKDFPQKALRLMARAFGYVPLIGALARQDISSGAVFVLQGGGDPVRGLLLESLANPNVDIRTGVATALRGYKNPEVVDALIRCLGQEGEAETGLRLAASESLSSFGVFTLPALEAAHKDNGPLVREGVARALGGIRDSKSLALLAVMIDDPAKPVRDAAFAAMGEQRSRAAVNVLIDRLGGPAEDVRGLCLEAIGQSVGDVFPDDEPESRRPDFSWTNELAGRLVNLVPVLVAKTEHLEKLAQLLGSIGSPAVRPLIQALKSERPADRNFSADVLGRIQEDTAIQPLKAAATDADSGVRLQVAKSLSSFYDLAVIEPLAQLLSDPDAGIRSAAVKGLSRTLSLSESRLDYQRFLASPPKIQILVELMNISDQENSETRDAASAVLGWIGKPAVEALLASLKSPNRRAREGALSALAATKEDQALIALIEYTKDPAARADDEMMIKLYGALGATENAKTLAVLLEGLKDGTEGRKTAAIEALSALGKVRAVDGLVAALAGDDSAVDSAIKSAISNLTEYYPEEDNFDWKAWWAKNRARYGLK